MILWAEMDADNTGQVSRQEFEEPMLKKPLHLRE